MNVGVVGDMTRRIAWVTGARGFVGQHLWNALGASGWHVEAFGRTAGQAVQPLTVSDLERSADMNGAPDRVFHLAGGATVGQSMADPLADFRSNVDTTVCVLDVVRRIKPACPVILASSAAVYGNGHTGPISIDAPVRPYSPYGHHKRLAEQLAVSFADNFGLRIGVIRLFSIYGPGLRKQLLFDICTQLTAGPDPIRLGGTGREVRDWCHVADAVQAMIDLAAPQPGTIAVYNIGSGHGVTTADVAAHVVAAWGDARDVVFSGASRAGDPFSLIAAQDSLPPCFKPTVDASEGFSQFVAWFRSVAKGSVLA